MEIIDSAVRLDSERGIDIPGVLAEMDRWGISRSVIAPSDEHAAVLNEEGNSLVLAAVQSFPSRLSGLAVANPWFGSKAVRMLSRAFDGGLCGLYMDSRRQGFNLTDEIVDPLLEVCARYGVPVYAHTGTPVCAMPFQLAELARRFPQLVFVMGHMAWSDFCGYDVIPAARQAENILIETSCATAGMVKSLVEAIGAERVLFGSGFPGSRHLPELDKMERAALTSTEMECVMGSNSRRVWGLDE